MKVATRDLLSELLVEAFDQPVAAATVRCLATYCRSMSDIPTAMPVDHFLLSVPAPEREPVRKRLEQTAVLSWRTADKLELVSLAPAFIPEYAEIMTKLSQYQAVLDTWQPDEATSDLTIALRKGTLLFNHHLFFEVHEVLEAQWVKETGQVKRFLQGLIQIAVAFYHVGNHNVRGALSLLQDGLEKISPHQPAFLDIELAEFVAELEACHVELQRLGSDGLAQFPAETVPRMRGVSDFPPRPDPAFTKRVEP